jgi:hypothetical protein
MKITPSFGRALGALFATLAMANACGSDQPAAGSRGTGGASGAVANGSGGTGAVGAGNEGGADSGGSTSSTPGTFDSIWKQASSDVLALDTASTSIPKQATVSVPGLYSVPDADMDDDVEVYQSIQNDELFTYAYVSGAQSHYLIKSPLSGAGGIYSYALGSKFSGIFQLQNGILTFIASFSVGTLVGSTTTRYEKFVGDFPPPAWPSEEVVLDLTTGGAP